MGTVRVIQGNITTSKVDGIVNSTNVGLANGGGVDGAIRGQAGPMLPPVLWKINNCDTGTAVLTPPFNMNCKGIIHTVGPIYRGGHAGEKNLLISCYQSVMEIANQQRYRTLAFPAICCGFYGYPLEEACDIAITEVRKAMQGKTSVQEVTFVCLEEHVLEAFQRRVQRP